MKTRAGLGVIAVAALFTWTSSDAAAAVLQIRPGTGTDFTVTAGNSFGFLSEPFDVVVDGILETTGPGLLSLEYLGFEAGYTNSFLFDGTLCFRTGETAVGADCGGSTSGGALDFEFWSDLDTAILDTVVWDNLSPPAQILSYSIGIIQEGPNQFLLLFDDSGRKEDDDHDDLGVRITFRPVKQVPEPTSLSMMLAGIAGVAALRRRSR